MEEAYVRDLVEARSFAAAEFVCRATFPPNVVAVEMRFHYDDGSMLTLEGQKVMTTQLAVPLPWWKRALARLKGNRWRGR